MQITKMLLPINHWSGRGGYSPLAIVLHRSQGSRDSVIAHFNNPNSQVSSHYLVCKSGEIIQFVEETDTAWTNGIYIQPDTQNALINYFYTRQVNGNRWTISIEIELLPSDKINSVQWQALVDLIKDICNRRGILKSRKALLGHYQFDRINKGFCPGLSSQEWETLVQQINLGGDIYFPETGYWLDRRFVTFFKAKGEVATCGYPLEGSHLDSDGVVRQVMENVMFEYYPSGLVRFGGLGQRYMQLRGENVQ